MSVYGHRYPGLGFIRLLETGPSGFTRGGRHFSWEEVSSVESSPASWVLELSGGAPASPFATVTLKDGSHLRLQGLHLVVEGREPRVDASTGTTDAYAELLGILDGAVSAAVASGASRAMARA